MKCHPAHGDDILASAVATYENVLEALEAQSKVADDLNNLMNKLAERAIDQRYAKLVISLKAIQPYGSQLRDLAHSFQDVLDPTARPSEASAVVAERVFGIPELLEQVLSYLPPRDLLVAQQVNRSTDVAIKGSSRLQRNLHMRPTRNPNFTTAFEKNSFPGLTVDVRKMQVNGLAWQGERVRTSAKDACRARLAIRFDGNAKLPLVGIQCRSMLLCQPALKRLIAQPTCCFTDYEVSPKADADPRSAGGLTVGDLFDAVDKVRKDHSHCALAEGPMHREDGTVKVDVRVCNDLELDPLDPIILTYRKSMRDRMQRETHRRSLSRQMEDRERMMNEFAAAKHRAHAQGERIPTLAEYQLACRKQERELRLRSGELNGVTGGISTSIY